jgi:hypothetical protein
MAPALLEESADERDRGEDGENDGEPRPHAATLAVPT